MKRSKVLSILVGSVVIVPGSVNLSTFIMTKAK